MMNESGRKSILLVEDEAIIALAERRNLEARGYAVAIEHSGEAAIAATLREPEIDLVLMDIDLGPGMDGTEAAKAILERRQLPVVFLSSHEEPDIVARTETITSYGYVVKNSSITVLDASIKMALKLFEANRQIWESERKHKALISNIQDVISIVGEDGYVTYTSDNFQRLLGWYGGTQEPMPIWDLIHPDERETLERKFTVLLTRHGATEAGVFRLRHKDGSYRWVEFTATNLLGDPVIAGVITTYHDISERKALEDRNIESNRMFQAVLDAIPQYICWKDRNSVFMGCNKNHAQLFGLKDSSSIIGKSDWDLHSGEEEIRGFIAADQAVMERDLAQYNIVERAHYPDKSERWLETNKVPIHAADGAVCGIMIAYSDITKSKELEDSLSREKYLLGALLENSSDFIYFKDLGSRFIRVGTAMASFLGEASPDDLLGKTDADYFTEDFAAMTREEEEFVAKTGATIRRERIDARPSGDSAWVLTEKMPLRDCEGGIVGTFGISKDISERKRAEDAVTESNALVRAISDSAQDAIAVINSRGRVTYWNRAAALTFGYSAQDMLGRELHELLEIDGESDARERGFAAFAESGRGPVVGGLKETKARRKDGSIVDIELAISSVRLANGWHAVGIMRDVTERKRDEERIRSLVEEKELILREVHHRMKNDMATINSLLSLQASTVGGDDAAQALQEAAGRVQAMATLYESLFRAQDFMTMPVGSFISTLAAQAVGRFPGAASVRLDLDLEDFSMPTKELRILGIIVNELVTNCMKHAFSSRENGVIGISLVSEGGRIRMRLSDDGVGMPEASVPAADPLRKGSGFGLTVVQSLARQLGAELRIEREGGTTFYLEFPSA